jgi:hypothetical protein
VVVAGLASAVVAATVYRGPGPQKEHESSL